MNLHKNSDKRLDCHLLSEAETRHEMIRDVILCEAADCLPVRQQNESAIMLIVMTTTN